MQVSIAVFRALSKTFSGKGGSGPLQKIGLYAYEGRCRWWLKVEKINRGHFLQKKCLNEYDMIRYEIVIMVGGQRTLQTPHTMQWAVRQQDTSAGSTSAVNSTSTRPTTSAVAATTTGTIATSLQSCVVTDSCGCLMALCASMHNKDYF